LRNIKKKKEKEKEKVGYPDINSSFLVESLSATKSNQKSALVKEKGKKAALIRIAGPRICISIIRPVCTQTRSSECY